MVVRARRHVEGADDTQHSHRDPLHYVVVGWRTEERRCLLNQLTKPCNSRVASFEILFRLGEYVEAARG